MNRLIAALAAVTILTLPTLAGAQPATVPHYDNGTRMVPAKVDADGYQGFFDAYPYHLQNNAFPALDTLIVANDVLRPMGLGWSVSPFGDRCVKIVRKSRGPSMAIKFYIYGSDNDVDYYPVLNDSVWVSRSAGVSDTLRADTLQFTLPGFGQTPGSLVAYKVPLPTFYMGRYIQLWATRTDSAGTTAGSYPKIGLTYEGRWK